VEFYYDLVSPYSYLAHHRIGRICEEYGAEGGNVVGVRHLHRCYPRPLWRGIYWPLEGKVRLVSERVFR